MSKNRDWRQSIAAIAELEERDAPTTLEARLAELQLVCEDAAALEGLSQCEAPVERNWPETTDLFLREKAKAIYGE